MTAENVSQDSLVQEIRAFNRFYVDMIGLHQRHFLGGPFTLAEARVLLEIGQNGKNTHRLLNECLRIDAGYLSRLVASFIRDGLAASSPSKEDGRSKVLELTPKGRKALAELNAKSDAQTAAMLAHLSQAEKNALAGRFAEIERSLARPAHFASERPEGKTADTAAPGFAVRVGLRPGDAGRIIALHGDLYAREYKYDGEFEAYVAKTFYEFLPGYDPVRDRVWRIEETAGSGKNGGEHETGRLLGCFAVLGKSAELAQLRWFVLSPQLRGKGLGKRLLQEAVAFCAERGHRRIFLETTADLDAAIHLYTQAGFELVREHTEETWGKTLTHRYYEKRL